MGIRILYINYWSLREPLTSSATFPYLELLEHNPKIERIDLITIERPSNHLRDVELPFSKTVHIPYYPKATTTLGLYFEMFHTLPKELVAKCQHTQYDLIMAKASLAGGIAFMVSSKTGLPFIVESFEPHSDYMAECKVWIKYGPRYLFAKYLERRQTTKAKYLVTVTRNQRNDMIYAGVDPTRVKVIPSITDLEKFAPNDQDRVRVREELDLPARSIIGIYVGKFGGLYLKEKAFLIFKRAFEEFKDFRLIILTPEKPEDVLAMATKYGLDTTLVRVLTVSHSEVPCYLSASDLAFSTIKPAPIKRYQCPVKNGEYWASGLPIVMTDGVSDDHILMRKQIGGVVFNKDLTDLGRTFRQLKEIMAEPDHRTVIQDLARRFKSIDIARRAYKEMF